MLVHLKGNMICVNKAPKHKIREALRESFITLDDGGAGTWDLIARGKNDTVTT